MDVTNFSDEESDNFYSGDEETSPPRKRIAIVKAVAVTVAAVMITLPTIPIEPPRIGDCRNSRPEAL